jgi:Integrase core domain
VYCAAVLDVFSRRVVGWSIDAAATATLVTNALGMAIDQRKATERTVIHSDQGTQFTSWAFTRRAIDSGLLPSMGSIGDCYDNAVIESFWSRMQVELLDRKRWGTRVELPNAIFEYLETPHQPKASSSSCRHACREGLVGVVDDVGDEAVVELADEFVEQVSERRDVVVAVVSATLVVSSSMRVVPDGGQGPDIAGCGEPVVLRSPSADPVRPP